MFAQASAMVLASQGSATAALHPFDIPRAFWEEQFGLVLAEAMAAGLAIVTTTNGAIPEVVRGAPVELVAAGDWPAIARALAAGSLSRDAGAGGLKDLQHLLREARPGEFARALEPFASELRSAGLVAEHAPKAVFDTCHVMGINVLGRAATDLRQRGEV